MLDARDSRSQTRIPRALLIGIVPLFRFTDGSSDPSFYPAPIMDM